MSSFDVFSNTITSMSTLLKVKYCQERSSVSSGVCDCSDDESNDMSLNTSEPESDVVFTVAAVPIPVSPVSVTISNDSVSAMSSIVPLMAIDETDCATDTGDGTRKSVRFSDANQILTDKDFSEKVHKYRTDIWYTVSCMTIIAISYIHLKHYVFLSMQARLM